MGELYEKIEELCNQKGIRVTTMCRESGVSRAALSDLKMNRSKSLSFPTLHKIAEYFNVSVDEILGTKTLHRGKRVPTDNPNDRYPYLLGKLLDGDITPEEKEELKEWERLNRIAGYLGQLTEEGKQEAEKRVKELSEIPRYQAQPSTEPTNPTPEGKDTSEE